MKPQYHQDDLVTILIMIHCFVDDFLKTFVLGMSFALKRPNNHHPPQKKHNLPLAELITLALFRFFTGHRNWKDFYRHIKTYHRQDFPNLPTYGNFIESMNGLSGFAALLLSAFCAFFRAKTGRSVPKMADSTKLEVCKIKREFTHKVCQRIAAKSKGSMGWFYGFKLHIVCNQLMQILDCRITPGNVDDRKGLEMVWNHIVGLIIADAGYVGKNWQEKASACDKHLFAAVRANMRKLMTKAQHELLKLRQFVENVFSVLKLRLGLENSLPRSELGHFAHYIWCLAAYQLRRYFILLCTTPLLA